MLVRLSSGQLAALNLGLEVQNLGLRMWRVACGVLGLEFGFGAVAE